MKTETRDGAVLTESVGMPVQQTAAVVDVGGGDSLSDSRNSLSASNTSITSTLSGGSMSSMSVCGEAGLGKLLVSPGSEYVYGVVLAGVAAAQLAGRQLGLSPRILGIIGIVAHVAAMAAPVVHGVLAVRDVMRVDEAQRRAALEANCADGGDVPDSLRVRMSIGEAVRDNWGVCVLAVPLLTAAWDFASMRGTSMVVGGKSMSVGGHGTVALMAVAVVCAQGMCRGDRVPSMAQVVLAAAGDVAVLSGYAVRWLAPDVAARYNAVAASYCVLGVLALAGAIAGAWLGARGVSAGGAKDVRGSGTADGGMGAGLDGRRRLGSSGRRQQVLGLAVSAVSGVLVLAGSVWAGGHGMEYAGRAAGAAKRAVDVLV